MKCVFAGLSDQGLVRSANQDAYYLDNPHGRFFIVADGMGGHAGGQEASRIAVETIQTYLNDYWQTGLAPQELLQEALLKANQGILQNQQTFPERADMGTTVVVLIFPSEQQPWCAHVGDSRLYRLRSQTLEQITQDHTWVSQAVKAGILTAEQARSHPWRHVLAQCLGREELNRIDIQPIDIEAGDRLLLCSDGLTEELSDEQIIPCLCAPAPCGETATTLVEAAKKEGGQDNITVVVVALEDETSPD
ncbi:Stp1/IreP family PP2C-type Ser/Thr phosphatase [Synechococcales cyanobacterium C]|uniref:Stp1/IreP family PP2C-type Ser/Thr phosphatase n=1 Tax=Petrachloros mirabilis ULC683 TaxID=2781853 RepID=A0A8K2A9R0_9CYAN|nr:Stp1/IreP family PP2C-type Ser/Thr phosphatase [Petrachloros mirabilis]NCJ08514.1 Stp1/IreP family PP2C-type Ser/Thr phosphatase [Petrachloros mirabilis ULC683]